MKKLLIITIICFNALVASAQTQKFDIMTYTPPKGWSVQNGDNAKVFTKIDKAKNTLGIIMLYPSINSSGDAKDDFKYVWKQIVQDSFGASANPETETGESNGFKLVNGGELIKYEGIQALAMLTVLSGKGKVISVLTITNEQSYVEFTQEMFESMTVDAKEKVEEKNTETIIQSNSAIGKKDILGEWYLSDGNIKISLWLAVNGHYKRIYQADAVKPIALNLYQTITFTGDGTYTLSGNTLKIIPKNGKAETYQIQIVSEKDSEGKTQRILQLLRPGSSETSDYYFVK